MPLYDKQFQVLIYLTFLFFLLPCLLIAVQKPLKSVFWLVWGRYFYVPNYLFDHYKNFFWSRILKWLIGVLTSIISVQVRSFFDKKVSLLAFLPFQLTQFSLCVHRYHFLIIFHLVFSSKVLPLCYIHKAPKKFQNSTSLVTRLMVI